MAYWKNIPANVWEYYIGGYQVIKKWLSYREQELLGRALRVEEAREVTNMARRCGDHPAAARVGRQLPQGESLRIRLGGADAASTAWGHSQPFRCRSVVRRDSRRTGILPVAEDTGTMPVPQADGATYNLNN